jgi:hypothetical protein
MGGRGHIRIETVQDAFVASFNESFFFSTSQELSQQVLKVHKAPRSASGMFWEFKRTEQWALRPRSFTPRVPLIPVRFLLYVLKEPAAGKRYRKYFECRAEQNRNRMDFGGAILCPADETGRSTPGKAFPMQDLNCWSAIAVRTRCV